MSEHISPLKAIRLHCLDCSCGSANEVRLCACTDCNLYPFRLGHNPNRKGMGRKDAFKQNADTTNDLDGFMNEPEE